MCLSSIRPYRCDSLDVTRPIPLTMKHNTPGIFSLSRDMGLSMPNSRRRGCSICTDLRKTATAAWLSSMSTSWSSTSIYKLASKPQECNYCLLSTKLRRPRFLDNRPQRTATRHTQPCPDDKAMKQSNERREHDHGVLKFKLAFRNSRYPAEACSKAGTVDKASIKAKDSPTDMRKKAKKSV